MKKVSLRFVLYLVVFLSSCSIQNTTTEKEKMQAMQDYDTTGIIAETWLGQLDSIGYKQIATIKLITDSTPYAQLAAFIVEKDKQYGKITDRTFVEYHIWTGKKLITYVPDIDAETLARMNLSRSTDGFYDLSPAFFSLIRTSETFRKHAARRYMQLLYRTSTEYKENVREALTLWLDSGSGWEVVHYNIGEDI